MSALSFGLIALCSFLISLLATPSVIRLAGLVGAVDKPNERKVHSKITPRFGGVAIYLSVTISLLVFFGLNRVTLGSTWLTGQQGVTLLAGMALMLGLGMWDDIFGLKASKKFLVQLVISSAVYFGGIRISLISIPLVGGHFALGILEFPVTVLWIAGITNAFNLIDGLDGLASGIALIAFATIIPIALLRHDPSSVLLALILAGSVVGFLRYNFNPAKIFLGDSGSLLLGFALATVSIMGSTKGSAAFAIVVPLLALGLPIMETFLSMARRFLRSFLPGYQSSGSILSKLSSMFQPDRGHIHHRLLDKGFSQRGAVLTLYVVSCMLGVGAFLVTVSNNVAASLVLVVVGVSVVIGVGKLKYKEMAILHNGILLPLYDRPILNRDSFQVFLDMVFVLLAVGTATFAVKGGKALVPDAFLLQATVILGIQLTVLWLAGVYKRTCRIIGLNDILDIVKATLFSVATTAFAVVCFPTVLGGISPLVLVLDFFFLLTLILGYRSSFFVLRHLFRQESRKGRRVLIYGADVDGLWMLEKIVQLDYAQIVPIGFIDDNPRMEGKRLNGYPVYGGHWKLERLANRERIDEIIVCSESIKLEALRRVRRIASERRILLTKAKMVLEELGRESGKTRTALPSTHLTPVQQEPEAYEGVGDTGIHAYPTNEPVVAGHSAA